MKRQRLFLGFLNPKGMLYWKGYYTVWKLWIYIECLQVNRMMQNGSQEFKIKMKFDINTYRFENFFSVVFSWSAESCITEN